MMKYPILVSAAAALLAVSCSGNGENDGKLDIAVLDPGHFHASLLMKSRLEGVSDTIKVFAPAENDVKAYVESIERFNARTGEDATSWVVEIYEGKDWLEKFLHSENTDIVVLAGRNSKKSDYILESANAGFNVLSDKPMAINQEGFDKLVKAYEAAEIQGAVIYDLMTERYDTLNILTRKMLNDREIFGELISGTPEMPAVEMSSVHHFYKKVDGTALTRPAWYYDVEEQGEGIADVTTHLIDLIFWQCFPDEPIRYSEDIGEIYATHWPTSITGEEFRESTGEEGFPGFLDKYVSEDTLRVYANGKLGFSVKNHFVSMAVTWNFEAEEGSGDTFSAIYRGTKATIRVIQDKTTGFIRQVFIEDLEGNRKMLEVPANARSGHEEHFSKVAQKFFAYARGEETMPEWEIANTLAKYHITTAAVKCAEKKSEN